MKMPPGRWKFAMAIYVMATFVPQTALVAAAQQMQDAISMSSDGWRPIVGTRRHQPVKHYANPNSDFDPVPAEVYETTTFPFSQKSTGFGKTEVAKDRKQGTKVKVGPHKLTGPYYAPSGPRQKLQAVKKPLVTQNKPRKPARGQTVAHSNRNEIFVPPPSLNPVSGGGFSYVKPVSQSNIKTREAQGFGLLGNNFGLSQQKQHVELSRFPLTGESILQRPTFFLTKPLQNDEYTRNLVPPPPRARPQQKNKSDTKISLYAFKEGPASDATANIPQFGGRPNQFLPQVVPTYDFTSQQQKPKLQSAKEQAVDVQVTKENLKQYPSATFSTVPSRNSYPIGFVDYDFQRPTRPSPTFSNSPSPLTYEVTEGKWVDTPSQHYQYRPQDGFFQYQNLRQPNARPGLLFQPDLASTRPPIFQAPLVDLSVPTFLPTPYKPEKTVLPTSPTQNEAATVYTQLSTKMNQYRGGALKDNPLFFDIKDVSTHYPILGTPEVQSESGTDSPSPVNENGEISNEISTTQKEIQKQRPRRPTKEPVTKPTSTRDPTKSRITNRRRPRPKVTTTTTEPAYEPIKSQETTEEVDIERPFRRRRPKPTANHVRENYPITSVENTKPEEEDNSSSRQRGRYRPRNRERTDTIQRKRLRPLQQSYEEITDPPQEQYLFEKEQSHSQENDQNTQSQTLETEVPASQYESAQEPPIQAIRKPFIEEVQTEQTILATTEEESKTNFHIPENEIDYTTNPHVGLDKTKEELTTTTPEPPTSEASEPNTVKSVRIRRPTKYDTSNRPRFSVKDYKQRLNQYTSTTPSTTTQARSNSDNLRFRFPSRVRSRPSPTTASSRVDENVDDDEPTTTSRTRFRPKEPRHETTTDNNIIITEKGIKSVNTRLRPFGRTKPTTEAAITSTKVSIRPNLFSARRRAGYPSLKNRIHYKNKKNDSLEQEVASEQTTEAEVNKIEDVEPLNAAESVTTELTSLGTTDIAVVNDANSEDTATEFVTEDIMKSDEYLQSQRVSDLTSSFKDYDKPGAFNAVAPTSRSIPNYFTISTDDPILPIEAFFPSLKEKEKARER